MIEDPPAPQHASATEGPVPAERESRASPGPLRRRIRRVAVVVGAVAGVMVLVVAVLTWRWFLSPRSVEVPRVDAVVVLAGGEGERLDRALGLMEKGTASVLVVNEAVHWFPPESRPVHDLCASPPTTFEVVCIRALPDSTRGEAQVVARLAEERHWTSLALVTSDYHLTRARRWFDRCFSGRVYPVAASSDRSAPMIVHEWLGTIAQFSVQRSCR